MGFFDKLKKAANFITGSGAKVNLELTGESINEPIHAKVITEISDADITVNNVYLLVRCTEKTTSVIEGDEGEEIEENEEIIYEDKIEISSGGLFKANEKLEFNQEINLPEDVQATIEEDEKRIIWEFQAALDVKGNDPDSGWITITLN